MLPVFSDGEGKCMIISGIAIIEATAKIITYRIHWLIRDLRELDVFSLVQKQRRAIVF